VQKIPITSKEAAALDEHAHAMSRKSIAFSRILGEFIGVTEDHPVWLCLQADGIITVEFFWLALMSIWWDLA